MNRLAEDHQGVQLDIGLAKVDADIDAESNAEDDHAGSKKLGSDNLTEHVVETVLQPEEVLPATKAHGVQIWTEIRPSLRAIEDMMSFRVKKKVGSEKNEQRVGNGQPLPPIEEARPVKGASEEDSEEEFYDLERSESDTIQEVPAADNVNASAKAADADGVPPDSLLPCKEELECLVQGGVPMALRGEVGYNIRSSFCTLNAYVQSVSFICFHDNSFGKPLLV